MDATLSAETGIDMRNAACVAGVGLTTFGRLPDHTPDDLGAWALREALDDAGMGLHDLDGLIVSRIPDYQHFGERMGLNPRYVGTTPGQGRMAGVAIQMAAMAIATGMATVVALVYGNDGRSKGATYGGASDQYGGGGLWAPYGMTSPGAMHAVMFQRHAHLYGTTSEQLAEIAVTFRRHAAMNPGAVMRTPITVADHQASRFVARPLHLLDYCLINDGGAAMILTTPERARDCRAKPVYLRGMGQASALKGSHLPPGDFWHAPMQRAAADVFRMAGVSRDELDALMIYDNFTPTVLFSLEGFGFCAPGESGGFVQGGTLGLGGRYPSNTDGGHLSNSYMQGWALNVEAVRQLRGACGDRQVQGARLIQYMCAAPLTTSIIYGVDAA